MQTDSKTYPAMISMDDKNYVLWQGGDSLEIHGSSLKGKHLPIVCDKFRDALCLAVFKKQNPTFVFTQFQNLSKFSTNEFQIRIYPSKMDYHKTSLYNKLIRKLASAGIRVVAGASLEYVKAVDGYLPVVLFDKNDSIDYAYYKRRLAVVASRILMKPAKALLELFGSGQKPLEKYV